MENLDPGEGGDVQRSHFRDFLSQALASEGLVILPLSSPLGAAGCREGYKYRRPLALIHLCLHQAPLSSLPIYLGSTCPSHGHHS